MTNTGEQGTSLFNESKQWNDGRLWHAWGCVPDHLLDFSFLCVFTFFFRREWHFIDSAVLSWLASQLHGLRTYRRFESPLETLRRLVATSWNDDFSSCFLSVWTHGHSSWVNTHQSHFAEMLSWEEGSPRGTP